MKLFKLLVVLAFVFVNFPFVLALDGNATYSNESMGANLAITKAKADVDIMVQRGIPTLRANESLQQALQLYGAQLALEEQGKKADYRLVMEYASSASNIKENAVKADDELKVFIESYTEASRTSNLSAMQDDYSAIVRSFKEERFEDTPGLINEGYSRMSQLQSVQTTLKLFYDNTSRSVKRFIFDNWKELLIAGVAMAMLLIIIYKAIIRLRTRRKIRKLNVRKRVLEDLEKRLQVDYFKKKTISEGQFNVKLARYKEMIRDIERQIPLLNEKLAKLAKK